MCWPLIAEVNLCTALLSTLAQCVCRSIWMWLTKPDLLQATWCVLQPSEESGGFGTTDTGEETVSASQQNQQHCQPGALHRPGDAGAGLQSHPGMTDTTGFHGWSECVNTGGKIMLYYNNFTWLGIFGLWSKNMKLLYFLVFIVFLFSYRS